MRHDDDRPVSDLAVPATLHDSLMARLELLQGVNEVAQTAAVIGRTFDHGTLADLSPLSPSELADALDRLVAAELVFRKGTGTNAAYAFKHALLRDAAYGSMLKAQRAALHRSLYETLVTRGGAAPEIRARHAEGADLTEAALDCWEEAGRAAIATPAFKEAVAGFRAAIRLCGVFGADPKWSLREQSLQVQLGQALIASSGYSDQTTHAAFERAAELAEANGDPDLQLPAIYGLWANRYVSGQSTEDLTNRFVKISETLADNGHQTIGLRMMTLERFHAANLHESLNLANRSIGLYQPEAHEGLKLRFGPDPRVAAGQYRGWCLWHLGLADQAAEQMEQSLVWARANNHVNTVSLALHGVAMTCFWLRSHERAEQVARDAVRLSEEMSLVHANAWGTFFLGVSLHRQGNASGLGIIEAGLEEIQHNRDRRFNPVHFSVAAEAHADGGHHENAARAMDQAFAALRDTIDVILTADLHRVRARITRAADASRTDEAETDLRRALDIARGQGALALELRAAVDLAKLLTDRGERQQAADLLRPVHASFTEGFKTQDLLDATALLDALR